MDLAWVVDKGRMKMCRTIYRALYKVAPELAKKTFLAHAGFYVSAINFSLAD